MKADAIFRVLLLFFVKSENKWQVTGGVGGMSKYIDISFDYDDDDDHGDSWW